MQAVTTQTFRGLQPPGTARAAWNFTVEAQATHRCRLATEPQPTGTPADGKPVGRRAVAD